MVTLQKKDLLSLAVLIALCGWLFFFQAGKLALTDPDETFYAQTAKEMLAKGEWVTPHLYGRPQFEKPIFFYWLIEISYKVFGVNEFAARFPSAVAGLIGVIVIYLLGTLLFGERAGFLSAVVLASNVEYIILSRACVTDMVLTVFLLLAILFFFYGQTAGKKLFYILSSVALALATLTKGPVAVVIFGGALIIYFVINRDLKGLFRMPLLQMAIVFIVVMAPWYWAIYKLHGQAFVDGFFGFHNVTRFLEAEHKIGSQVYYNIPIMFGGFFPWSIFLPVGFWWAIKKISGRQSPLTGGKNGLVFALIWFVLIFGFFTASSTKLPTYIFPCFISLALIIGVLFDNFLEGNLPRLIEKGVKISYYVLATIILLGWAGGAIYAKLDYPEMLTGVVASSLFLAFGILLSLAMFLNKKFLVAILLIPYAIVLFLYPLNMLVVPEIERYETSKEVAYKINTLMEPDEALGAESNYLAGLAFYTGKFPIDLDKHHIQIQFMNSRGRVWAVMKEKNHGHLYDPEITKEYVKPSYVVYKVGKRALVTNEVPAGGYIKKREAPR
ncbi:MAG: glycosyltransferase family 39 protein [Candidatus Omnitrophica bacterium]|nr:glycosyltransferase family 39 protein [Candidatus Omnitrophota bacterium]MCM8791141.1 glycosyltransferase family 39 protein [Candidatus Omnitrophota bacterium]